MFYNQHRRFLRVICCSKFFSCGFIFKDIFFTKNNAFLQKKLFRLLAVRSALSFCVQDNLLFHFVCLLLALYMKTCYK